MKILFTLVALATAGPLAAQAAPPSYVPHRVYDTKAKRFIDFESMATRLASLDLVFVGEEHDDPATHRMELALLEGLARRRDTAVVLSLEMFERDAQPLLDHYLDGLIAESLFLSRSRPWPRYATDYRGLVELARAKGWPVVAANTPRRLASLVNRGGLAALDTLDEATRSLGAAKSRCPTDDDYADSFRAVMKGMPSHGGASATPEEAARGVERMYQAQCFKDETMGESIARAWAPGRLVVQFNGSFHSDFKRGTVERALDRIKGARSAVISLLPVASLDDEPAKPERKRADYLIYVLKPPPARADPAALTIADRMALADTIRAVAQTFIAAVSSLDVTQLMDQFTTDSDFVYVDNGRIYPSREALAAAGGEFLQRTRRLTGRWDSSHTIVLGRNAATFTGVFKADGEDREGKPVWTTGKVWTFVYERRRGRWTIVQAHETNGR